MFEDQTVIVSKTKKNFNVDIFPIRQNQNSKRRNFVRKNMTDKTRARYAIKHKPSVNRSNKKDDWYVVVTINILTNKQKKSSCNMLNEDTTVENNDCDFVGISGVKQSLSEGNRSLKIFNSVFPPAESVFFIHVCINFLLLLYHTVTCYQIPCCNNE